MVAAPGVSWACISISNKMKSVSNLADGSLLLNMLHRDSATRASHVRAKP
jgi:hypothetical protein